MGAHEKNPLVVIYITHYYIQPVCCLLNTAVEIPHSVTDPLQPQCTCENTWSQLDPLEMRLFQREQWKAVFERH